MSPTPTGSTQPVFGSAAAVLELAVSGRWRSPETTTALAEAACAGARAASDRATALLAEGWLIHGLALLGRGPVGAARATAALGEAHREGREAAAARLRVGLAAVAREAGDLDSARALLDPVLRTGAHEPVLAADAHVEAVRCGGRSARGDLLAAADTAAEHVRRLGGEQAILGLAALDAALAHRHRRAGRSQAAVDRAREGLRRLHVDHPAELEPISPHLAARLTEELVLALLDDAHPAAARAAAEPTLSWSASPATVMPLARVRLALAQRVHLPAGERDAGLAAVTWAARAGLDDLPALDADCQGLLAEIHEQRGELSEALAASRRAHQALRAHSARVEQTLVVLGRGAAATRLPEAPDRSGGLHRPIGGDLRRPIGAGPGPVSATTPLSAVSRSGPDGPAVAWPVPDRPKRSDEPVPGSSVGDRPGGADQPAPGWAGTGRSERVDDPARADRGPRGEHGSDNDWASFTDWPDGSWSRAPRTAPAPAGDLSPDLTDDGDDRVAAAYGTAHWDGDEPSWYRPADLNGDAPRDVAAGSGDEPSPDPAADPVDDLFEPGESRSLGLAAVDIATPTGRLTGAPARALLCHVADHVRAQLPPNSRLRLLPGDVIVVVLPPVGPDVVARWMRSLSGGLTARWVEYAAETPRSALRVAVGAFDPAHPAADNVRALCARLDGVAWQAGGGSTDQPSSGRHVAGARRVPDSDPGSAGGGGGRRRRLDTGRGPIVTEDRAGRSAAPDRSAGADPVDPPSGPRASSARPDSIGRASSARLVFGGVDQAPSAWPGDVDQAPATLLGGVDLAPSATRAGAERPSVPDGGVDLAPPASLGDLESTSVARPDGINRAALARLTALSRLGTVPVAAVGLNAEAGRPPCVATAAEPERATGSVADLVGAGGLAEAVRRVRPTEVGPPDLESGLSGERHGERGGLGHPDAGSNNSDRPHAGVGGVADPDPDTSGTGYAGLAAESVEHPGVATNGAGFPTPDTTGSEHPPAGGQGAALPPDGPGGRGRSGEARSISELSFAELLAGALAAYRDT